MTDLTHAQPSTRAPPVTEYPMRRFTLAETQASPWHILRVAPPMVRKVVEALNDALKPEDGRAYAPMEKFRPRNHWRPRHRPLFPGYVFAELASDKALDIARANHAVREVMCRDGRPVRVPALIIGNLVLLEANGEFDLSDRKTGSTRTKRGGGKGRNEALSRWKNGQRVKIDDGPFASFIGTIMRDKGDRLDVLISIFGRETVVELDEEMIEEVA